MDEIYYPRQLNRPTYLFWRFTHKDIAVLFALFALAVGPAGVWDWYPLGTSIMIWLGIVIADGAVIAIKPRGWPTHVWKSLWQPRALVPGHTFHRCFILSEVPGRKPSFWQQLIRKLRS